MTPAAATLLLTLNERGIGFQLVGRMKRREEREREVGEVGEGGECKRQCFLGSLPPSASLPPLGESRTFRGCLREEQLRVLMPWNRVFPRQYICAIHQELNVTKTDFEYHLQKNNRKTLAP